ncbi:expressed protein [Phakopsora pachyrhizi]|uniref:Expressed protein n=1 Tax=Phakopsora pachyrhizi TaxID=170000 RepID=A0AAV0BSR8_PHAPC|nr:expressed protein [Phakopsora pachyrhizi]
MSQPKRVRRMQPEVILKSGQKSIDAKPPISRKSISKKASRRNLRQNSTTHVHELDIAHQPVSECDEVDNDADDEGDSTDDCSGGDKRLENVNGYGRKCEVNTQSSGTLSLAEIKGDQALLILQGSALVTRVDDSSQTVESLDGAPLSDSISSTSRSSDSISCTPESHKLLQDSMFFKNLLSSSPSTSSSLSSSLSPQKAFLSEGLAGISVEKNSIQVKIPVAQRSASRLDFNLPCPPPRSPLVLSNLISQQQRFSNSISSPCYSHPTLSINSSSSSDEKPKEVSTSQLYYEFNQPRNNKVSLLSSLDSSSSNLIDEIQTPLSLIHSVKDQNISCLPLPGSNPLLSIADLKNSQVDCTSSLQSDFYNTSELPTFLSVSPINFCTPQDPFISKPRALEHSEIHETLPSSHSYKHSNSEHTSISMKQKKLNKSFSKKSLEAATKANRNHQESPTSGAFSTAHSPAPRALQVIPKVSQIPFHSPRQPNFPLSLSRIPAISAESKKSASKDLGQSPRLGGSVTKKSRPKSLALWDQIPSLRAQNLSSPIESHACSPDSSPLQVNQDYSGKLENFKGHGEGLWCAKLEQWDSQKMLTSSNGLEGLQNNYEAAEEEEEGVESETFAAALETDFKTNLGEVRKSPEKSEHSDMKAFLSKVTKGLSETPIEKVVPLPKVSTNQSPFQSIVPKLPSLKSTLLRQDCLSLSSAKATDLGLNHQKGGFLSASLPPTGKQAQICDDHLTVPKRLRRRSRSLINLGSSALVNNNLFAPKSELMITLPSLPAIPRRNSFTMTRPNCAISSEESQFSAQSKVEPSLSYNHKDEFDLKLELLQKAIDTGNIESLDVPSLIKWEDEEPNSDLSKNKVGLNVEFEDSSGQDIGYRLSKDEVNLTSSITYSTSVAPSVEKLSKTSISSIPSSNSQYSSRVIHKPTSSTFKKQVSHQFDDFQQTDFSIPAHTTIRKTLHIPLLSETLQVEDDSVEDTGEQEVIDNEHSSKSELYRSPSLSTSSFQRSLHRKTSSLNTISNSFLQSDTGTRADSLSGSDRRISSESNVLSTNHEKLCGTQKSDDSTFESVKLVKKVLPKNLTGNESHLSVSKSSISDNYHSFHTSSYPLAKPEAGKSNVDHKLPGQFTRSSSSSSSIGSKLKKLGKRFGLKNSVDLTQRNRDVMHSPRAVPDSNQRKTHNKSISSIGSAYLMRDTLQSQLQYSEKSKDHLECDGVSRSYIIPVAKFDALMSGEEAETIERGNCGGPKLNTSQFKRSEEHSYQKNRSGSVRSKTSNKSTGQGVEYQNELPRTMSVKVRESMDDTKGRDPFLSSVYNTLEREELLKKREVSRLDDILKKHQEEEKNYIKNLAKQLAERKK